ncbi:uncharacterized protein LOC134680974 isoform X2 [Mytilus trossulus]|uniref:uncharacterized protein LOC134680974 isoform X2 n=1 Tax=Mytilus trossulus TaxID=6551 RepID=UPI003004F156
MEAPRVEPLTKFVENICVICGFVFVQKETKSDGFVITNKFLHRKLKLTTERFCEIEKVVGNLQRKKKDDNGVCINCYRAVERVLRLEKEAKKTRARLLKLIETVEQSGKQSDTERLPGNTTNRVGANSGCNVTCNKAIPFNEHNHLAKYVLIAVKPSTVNNCDQNVSKQADSTETVSRLLGFEQDDNINTETFGRSLGLEQADNTETFGRSLGLEQADNTETFVRSLGLEQAENVDNVVCSLGHVGREQADNIVNSGCSLGLEQDDNIQTVGHSLKLDQQADNTDNVGRSIGLEQADMYTETVSCSLGIKQADTCSSETVGCSLGLEQADTCSSETVGCSLGPRSGSDDSNQTFIPESRKRKRKVDIRPNNTRTNRNKDKKVKSVPAKNLTNQDSNQDVTCSQDTVDDDDDSNPTMYLVKTRLPKGADEIPKNNYQFVRSDFEHNYTKNAKVLPWVQGKQFVCPYCCTDKTGRSFDTEYELNMHKITHTGTMPQICQSCWKCFGTKEELFKHNFMVHNDLYRKQIEAQKNKYYRKIIPVEEGTSLQAILSMDKFKESQTQNKLQVFSGDRETIEIHINEESASSSKINPLIQDAVDLIDKSPAQLETVNPSFDKDASENYIKIEPESPTSYPLNQNAVHNNEGQQRPIEDFSCNYNAIESQVEETSGLPTMHPLNQDAVHNREGYEAYKLSYDYKLIEPQSPTSRNLHEHGKHNNDVLKKHFKMQKLSNPNSIEFCIKKKPESFKIYPIKLVAVHPSGNDKLQTELETKELSSRYNRIETQIEEAPEIHSVHPLKQDAEHNNEGQKSPGETQKRSELNTVYPVELVAVHTNDGLPSVHPLNQDAVHMKEGFQTHLETQKVVSDHDTIEVHIKEEPAWPEVHVIDQNAVHINEGLKNHQEIKNLSCVPNTCNKKESVTMEETELPTMHSSQGDAMYNHDRIQKHLEPHKLSLNHNQDNTIGFCIKEEPELPTIHPLEQDAEAIPEASQLQAQASATIFEQLQKEPLISHMDCLSQTEDSNHGNLHICSICNKEFKSLKGLQWHLCKKTYTCEICNAEFVADFLLQKHIEKQHRNQNIFLCGICKAPFDAKIDRENHAKLVHGKRKKFHCKMCSIDFPNKYSRKKHNRLIHTGQIFFCNLCEKNLATKSSLERHNAETHSGLAKKNFACEICHKTFLRKSGLVRHMATHKKTKSFTCSTCSETFDCENDLWEHYKLCKKDVFQESS